MHEPLGWIMTIAFIACGIPQAWQCYRQGHSKGLSPTFIALWFLGEICGLFYSFGIKPLEIPLVLNYGFSILVTLVIIRYMVIPRWKMKILKNKLARIWTNS